jgi:hypothetical protein
MYGTDINFASDLDPFFGLVTGQECLSQALARRLYCERGLLWSDENYGTDIVQYVSSSHTRSKEFLVASAIANELNKDERVESADVTTVLISQDRMDTTITVVGDEGPFELNVSVSPNLFLVEETL